MPLVFELENPYKFQSDKSKKITLTRIFCSDFDGFTIVQVES